MLRQHEIPDRAYVGMLREIATIVILEPVTPGRGLRNCAAALAFDCNLVELWLGADTDVRTCVQAKLCHDGWHRGPSGGEVRLRSLGLMCLAGPTESIDDIIIISESRRRCLI